MADTPTTCTACIRRAHLIDEQRVRIHELKQRAMTAELRLASITATAGNLVDIGDDYAKLVAELRGDNQQLRARLLDSARVSFLLSLLVIVVALSVVLL
jgi:hypothetical protein